MDVWARLVTSAAVMALALLLFSPRANADELDDLLAAGRYVEGEAIVALTDDEGLAAQSDAPYEVTPLMQVSPSSVGEAPAGALTSQSEQTVALSLVTSDDLTTEELLRTLSDDPRVAFAEPNYLCELPLTPAAGGAASDTSLVGNLTPLQWGNWAGSEVMRPGSAAANPSINVPNFGADWRGANMDKRVVVALLDTAVYYEHPDLVNVIYHFSPEQQDALGCGEWGFNAVGKGANASAFDDDSMAHGHGTHTAGILGAEWNGSGTSGVASNVSIVAIELADGDGKESLADALCAFDFVNRFNEQASEADRIRVTSNSWSEYMSSRALDAAIRDLGERWGIVSFFSAGNDSKNNDYYEKTPSSLADNPYAVVVANTKQTDELDSGSEYGLATVDLAAPGTSIFSTTVPSRGQYYPDATRASNALYVGFDSDSEPNVTVSQLYEEGSPALCDDDTVVKDDIGAQADDAHFFGSRSLKVEVDPSYSVGTLWTGDKIYDLRFDVDLTGTDIADELAGKGGLHFGMALTSADGHGGSVQALSTNAAEITIKELDESGEVADVTRPVMSICANSAAFGSSDWGAVDLVMTHDDFADEELNDEAALDVVATRIEGDHLLVNLRVALGDGGTTLFVDSLGIGTSTASYEFATGTSMSTPAVAGAAAVLASRGYEGKELAALVRSMVRIPEAGALKVRSGGVFDFTAEGSPDAPDDEVEALAPAIMEVATQGTTVTLTGEHFGSAPGSAELSRYVVGTARTPVAASVASWSEGEVVLELESEPRGILCVVLSNAAGKHDTRFFFAGKSENIYEQDLPFDASTEDAYVFGDGQGDWETKGPLVGLGCKLYYLPAYEGKSDSVPAFRRMRCFDLKAQTWFTLPDLPEWLQDVSATMYDGKIVVEGATMRVLDTGEPTALPKGEEPEERIYAYDPSVGSWTKASSEGVHLEQSIVNDGGQLKLVGGGRPDPLYPDFDFMQIPIPVTSYDLSSGAGEELCDLPKVCRNPLVAARDGSMLLYEATNTGGTVVRVQDGQATDLSASLPKYFLAEEGEPEIQAWGVVQRYPYRAVVAPTADGFVLVGPPAADGSSDTYLLKDTSDAFEPYALRSSDDRVYAQAACTYRGRLFVIGSAWFEPEQSLFRATAMDVPEYPGDIPCEQDDPEPTPEPTPEPKPDRTSVLPKTDDPSNPASSLAGICAAGFVVLLAGFAIRDRTKPTLKAPETSEK